VRALVTDHSAASGLALREVPDPVRDPATVLVEVRHVSLNFGDVSGARSPDAVDGHVPGWDASGVVLETAPDGPPVGSRVLTFGYDGAWAARRQVPASELAVVPDDVDLAAAAALPVAGVTALRALRRSGSLLGRRVLVTGASGGVGRFAVQLAARAGAHVVAQARRGAGLAELGADEVVASLDHIDPVDVVVDNVGGQQLVTAWQKLNVGGVIQSIGWTSLEPAVFPVYATVGPAKSLTSFQAGTDFGPDLALLMGLVAEGALNVDIGWQGSWTRTDEAVAELLGRRVSGKAILDVDA
jgi:NADPH2:quinone reductase